jgi:transcriptional regulator with XRE-family HTH domain
VTIDPLIYQRVLGEEIRALRKQRGLTRKELLSRLPHEISIQTLATYETGTRQCTVVRLAELCSAMNARPQDLLSRVQRRLHDQDEPGQLVVDLRHVVRENDDALFPLRRWATDRLQSAGAPVVNLDLIALEHLAALCGIPAVDLISRLRRLSH